MCFKNRAVYETIWESIVQPDRWQYGACALHAVYLRLQTNTQNTYYFLSFQCNSGCTNAPQRYVMRTLPGYSSSFAPKTHTCYMASPSHAD